jgi:DNA-binding IclR family transcriptional regulator
MHGLHVSSMSRLLSTMAKEGFVRRASAEGRYLLGFAILELAAFAKEAIDVRASAAPIVWELAGRTGQTVSFAIRSELEAVVIERVLGVARTFAYVSWVGRQLPLHASAHGKCLLAFLPLAERDDLVAKLGDTRDVLRKYTPNTISTIPALKRDLSALRQLGYAVTRGEYDPDACAVAAPVFDYEGSVCGSLGMPVPMHTFSARRERALADLAREAAARISGQLGATRAQGKGDARAAATG